MTIVMSEVDLIFVPQWSPFQPPLSTPSLSAWLSRENINHRCFDLNIKFYHWLLSDECAKLLMKEVERQDFSRDEKEAYKAIFTSNKIFSENIFGRAGWNNRIIDKSYLSNRSLETYLQAISEVNEYFSISPYEFSLKGGSLSIDNLSYLLINPPKIIEQFTLSFINEYLELPRSKIVGLSCIGQEQLYFTLLIGRELKRNSISKVVIGGTIFTRMYNRGVIPKRWFLENFDIIVKNEGEKPLVNLVKLERQQDISGIPGLIYLDGVPVETNSSPPLHPEEVPAPNFSKLHLTEYISPEITLPILGSRGCYWGKCAFCHHGMVYGEKYSSHKVENLLKQVSYLSKKYNVKNFAFNDEAIPPKLLRKIGEKFPKSAITNWSFTGLIKFEKYFTFEDFKLANDAGFRSLYVGLESGSEKVLALMQKNNTQSTMIKNLKDAHASNIWVHCFVFFGFPGETEEDAEETIRFILSNREIIGSVGCGTFSLEHDAPIHKSPTLYGVDIISKSSDSLNVYYSYKVSKGIDHKLALSWMRKLNKKIYSIDKFATTNWIPREHQLMLLKHYSVDELVKWGIEVKKNSGFPTQGAITKFISEIKHDSYSIFVSSIFRTVLKARGNYREAMQEMLKMEIDIELAAELSKDIFEKFGCKNETNSHAFTPKVI